MKNNHNIKFQFVSVLPNSRKKKILLEEREENLPPINESTSVSGVNCSRRCVFRTWKERRRKYEWQNSRVYHGKAHIFLVSWCGPYLLSGFKPCRGSSLIGKVETKLGCQKKMWKMDFIFLFLKKLKTRLFVNLEQNYNIYWKIKNFYKIVIFHI